ncbi:hypothetical protein LTR62_004493 [Meristemomyces frigidus]|uniref:Uncharacterized protein n=1 Tax=Meristemomyces frigidus TaxID=1508187 RepID=A0AAN7THL0_9PEZI|nr:hypothetical protein LTR62_004493 [Meristemomyces frigidus]
MAQTRFDDNLRHLQEYLNSNNVHNAAEARVMLQDCIDRFRIPPDKNLWLEAVRHAYRQYFALSEEINDLCTLAHARLPTRMMRSELWPLDCFGIHMVKPLDVPMYNILLLADVDVGGGHLKERFMLLARATAMGREIRENARRVLGL